MAVPETSRERLVSQVAEIAGRVCASEGIELVDVELKGSGAHRLLRITIDAPGGASHQHCEFVSKNVGVILDMEDVIPGAGYRLEVSSPGIERPLRREADFERFAGRLAKVVLRMAGGGSRSWEGTLGGCSDGEVTLQPASGEPVRFKLGDVERANLVFRW